MIRVTIATTLGQVISKIVETENKFLHKLTFGIGENGNKKPRNVRGKKRRYRNK